MAIMQTRRDFLTAMSGAGTLGLFSAPRALAAEGPLETTSVRLFKSSLICSAAPQYAAEELLRAEGFKEIAYIEATRNELPQVFVDG
jgi:NitT/TauT family transport system substrate-binding protein